MDEWIGGSYLEAGNDYEEDENRWKRKKRCLGNLLEITSLIVLDG